MAIWSLETASDFTDFFFPLEEDKNFFHEMVRSYLEESMSAAKVWRPLYMLRGEPMKQPDFFEIGDTDVIGMSQKAVEILRSLFNPDIELLPIETDAGKYYALNILNTIDCLNKEESTFRMAKNGIIVSYDSLEFYEGKLQGHAIFKIPELPYNTFITDKVVDQYEEHSLQGLSFDTESNLIWYPM